MSVAEKSQVSDNEFPMQGEEEEEGVPFHPDGEEETPAKPAAAAGRDETLFLSPNVSSGATKRKSIAIDGLDEEEEDGMETPLRPNARGNAEPDTPATTPRRRSTGPRRRRKRRRVVVDNDETELTSDHIKTMLRDTRDIVQQHRVHPAMNVAGAGEEKGLEDENAAGHDHRYKYIPRRTRMKKLASTKRITSLPYERLLERPCTGDDGGLHPSLLRLWEMNASRLRGEELPFRMRGEAGEEQRRQLAEDAMRKAAAEEAELNQQDEEDVELARRADGSLATAGEGRISTDLPPVAEEEEEENNPEFPAPEDEDIPMPFDNEEEEEEFPPPEEGFAEDMVGMASPTKSIDSKKSDFSLGAVNDLEGDLEDEPRQEQGDNLVSSSTKWHKHTVKVLGMLKRNMDAIDEDKDGEDKVKELSYNKLSYGTSRRTACGVFFELLQLKTWDFIEMTQDKSYGDIKILQGARFNEEPPAE